MLKALLPAMVDRVNGRDSMLCSWERILLDGAYDTISYGNFVGAVRGLYSRSRQIMPIASAQVDRTAAAGYIRNIIHLCNLLGPGQQTATLTGSNGRPN